MRPVLIDLPFGVPLYGYGSMLLVSVVVGLLLASRFAARDGLPAAAMTRSFPWILLSAMAGARLLFVLTNPGLFDDLWSAAAFWHGGVVAYGGFLGGFAAAVLFCRANRIQLLAYADCAAPSLCTGLFFTRIGCFLAGCDFGHAWDGPWAVRFPAGSPAYLQQRLEGVLPTGAAQSLPVHPTQLYESMVGLLLLGLLLWVRQRRKLPGEILAAFVMGYAALRYGIEVLRADSQRGAFAGFSTSQIIGVVTFFAAATLLWTVRRRRPVVAAADR